MTTPDADIRAIASLPIETFAAGSAVLVAGTKTGRLLVLERGAVEVVSDGVRIGEVREPGAIFGELAALLDLPHTADVRALDESTFRVAGAESFLHTDPAAALYVARAMARRVNVATDALAELTRDGDAEPGRATVDPVVGRVAGMLHDDGSDGAFPWYSMIPPWLLAAVNRMPTVTFAPGDSVLEAGSRTGRLLILEDGAVEVVRDGRQIRTVAGRGAVLGEMATLLDQPHSADVRALRPSTFRVADASSFLHSDPAAVLYVAVVMAKRIDSATRALVEATRRLDQTRQPDRLATILERIGRLLRIPGEPTPANS